ncbi:MAG: transporter substrate-binding domain-containing protein [Ruminiclostridium sp.]|nr:transporter substrate-binding domain-containing protein [Ruminiclostridium sp.]
MKHTNKRMTALATALALMITAAGCGHSENGVPVTAMPAEGQIADSPSPAQMTELTTTAPAYAMPGVTVIAPEYLAEISTMEPVSDPNKKIGILSLLRMDEDAYTEYRLSQARMYMFLIARGLAKIPEEMVDSMRNNGIASPLFYDTLDSMIMGLQSGELDSIGLSQSIAKYVVSRNENLEMGITVDMEKADDFDKFIIDGISQGYSFMMMEDRVALRDEFNRVIADMKSDGTLEKLKKAYIDDVIAGKDPEPVAFEKNSGETIKVAITGSLPPMDFIAPDGTPAGFNTAILAEIGKRLGKNIELLQVDSLGRAAALASGFVDVVFWTRGRANTSMGETQGEIDAYIENTVKSNLTEQQLEVFNAVSEKLRLISYDDVVNRDVPDGTVCTQPYFTDVGSMVRLKQ